MTVTLHPGMQWIPRGTFRMGSDRFYPEEAPVHTVTVGGFWMDAHSRVVLRKRVEKCPFSQSIHEGTIPEVALVRGIEL